MTEIVLGWIEASRAASPWLGVVVFTLGAAATGVGAVVAGKVLRPRRPSFTKSSPYECGLEPVGDARGPVPVRFYVVAMIFLVLDVEAALLYPWAVRFGEGSTFLLVEFLVFAGVIAVGFAWAWRKGALDWR